MWTPLTPEDSARAEAFITLMRDRPEAEWEGLSVLESQLLLWIKTARAANASRGATLGGMYGENWLPCSTDLIKSALFERIRSGKDPLPEPPPIGFACPWYACVDDPNPHMIYDVRFGNPWKSLNIKGTPDGDNFVSLYQNTYEIVDTYEIVEPISDIYTIKDRGHKTSYRWKLWFDSSWKHPSAPNLQNGAWMMQIIP